MQNIFSLSAEVSHDEAKMPLFCLVVRDLCRQGKCFFCRILTDILLKKFQYSSCQISLFEQLKLEVSIVNASAWYFDILQVKSEILIFSMLHLGIQIFCIQNQVLNFEYFDMQNIQLSIVLPVKSLSFMIACQISKLRYLACKSWDFRILKYPVWKNIGILRIGMLIFIFNIRYA